MTPTTPEGESGHPDAAVDDETCSLWARAAACSRWRMTASSRSPETPRMESIHYEFVMDTGESDQRLNLLHHNVKKYGTVFNTVSPGTDLAGVLRRKSAYDAGPAL